MKLGAERYLNYSEKEYVYMKGGVTCDVLLPGLGWYVRTLLLI